MHRNHFTAGSRKEDNMVTDTHHCAECNKECEELKMPIKLERHPLPASAAKWFCSFDCYEKYMKDDTDGYFERE